VSKLLGIEKQRDKFNELLYEMKKGNFNVLFVKGEKGVGKSSLLREFSSICQNEKEPVLNILVSNEKPLGQFNLANVSPFKTMEHAIDLLLKAKNISAKKKLAINMSLSALSAIPLAGDSIRAAKELVRDWKQYKAESSSEAKKIQNTHLAELFDTFMAKAEVETFVLMLDDAEWTDPNSIELLSLLFDNLSDKKCLIVMSFNDENLNSPSIPFNTLLERGYPNIKINNLSDINTNLHCKNLINNYKHNNDFNRWIYNKTLGNPGLIEEYNQYFLVSPAFDKKGKLIISLDNEKLLSSSHIAIAKSLETLSDESINILSAGSIEGNEFSVYILSKLLETDIMTLIQKLRVIAKNTNIIKSLGPHKKYGVKSTLYSFTKSYYSDYFRKSLEYEEYVSLNGILSAILKVQYDLANEEEKKQIAPYLVAYLKATGSEKESNDLLKEILSKYDEDTKALLTQNDSDLFSVGMTENDDLSVIENELYEQETGIEFDPDLLEFSNYRKIIVKLFNQNKYDKSIEKALFCLENLSNLSDSQVAMINIMIARSYVEENDLENAFEYLKVATVNDFTDPNINCLYLNTRSLYFAKSGNQKRAISILKKAAELNKDISDEMKLLVMFNIANVLESGKENDKIKFQSAANNFANEMKINIEL